MAQTALFLFLASALVFVATLPSLNATTLDDTADQQRDWKAKGVLPVNTVFNPYGPLVRPLEKLMLLRVFPEALANRLNGVSKRFDSLSGGTFGMMKRSPYPIEYDYSGQLMRA